MDWKVEKVKNQGVDSKIVVRDALGREIPQDYSGFEKPREMERGLSVSVAEFADFIRTRAQEKEGGK